MTLGSSPVQARTVFRQNTAPSDTSVVWFDTSVNPSVLKQYDTSQSKWIEVGGDQIENLSAPYAADLPDAGAVTEPTMAYVDDLDDYVATYKGPAWKRMRNKATFSFAPQSIASGMVSKWPFENEGVTTTATDTVDGNDGTINGATYDTDSLQGSHAMLFDAANSENVDIGAIPSNLQLCEQQNLCLVAAVKTTTADSAFMGVYSSGSRGYYLGVSTNGTPKFQIRNENNGNADRVTGATDITDGKYHLIHGVRNGLDANSMTVYVDGAEDNTTVQANQGAGTFTASGNFRLGERGNGTLYYTGRLDVPEAVQAAPTAADIDAHARYYGVGV